MSVQRITGGNRHVIIPLDDDAVLNPSPDALYFNTTGTVMLEDSQGHVVPFEVVASQTLNDRPTKVLFTGTTTGMVVIGLYNTPFESGQTIPYAPILKP